VAPGGYLWWYIDALSDDGEHGLSIIAFVGSVFSPYYAWARARGRPDPENHCAVNVALYGRGGKRWAMTERSRRHVQREAHRFQVGPSALEWDGAALTVRFDEMSVPVPRRIRGQVVVRPAGLCTFVGALDDAGRHRWGPLAPCARVEVDLAHAGVRWQGHAYLDSNEGDEPIERAFHEWDWSRALLRDGSTAVIYDVRQKLGAERLLAMRFAPDGTATPFVAPPRQALPATLWRVPRYMRTDPAEPARELQRMEDAPFYARAVVSSGLLGERVVSVHETVNMPRLVSPLVRLMLPWRMPRVP
jgi:carotenoid 1,2-hydratase